ncbi:putative ribonuclease H-like domain-containing protein [Tanacetum coccineum]
MAISSSSSSSSSDKEVQNCSKQCLESFKTLQKNFDSEREKHSRARLEIQGYELALESLESRILEHEKNELAWGENMSFKTTSLSAENQMSAKVKNGLGYGTQLDEMSNKSKTDSEISMSVFEVRSSDEEITPANDRFSKEDGYHAVPPLITGNFLTPRADISFAGLDGYAIRKKIIESKTTELNTKPSETVGALTRTGLITPIKKNKKRAVHKVSTARLVSTAMPVSIARPVSTARPVSIIRPFAPKIAQTSGVIRPIYPRMNNVRPRGSYSPIKRFYYTKPTFRPKYLKQDVKTFRVQNITTAGTRAVVNTGKGKMDTDLKKSRWVWRPKGNYLDHVSKDSGSFMLKKDNPEILLQDHAVVDSGCSIHMTGNKAYLSDYEDYNGGFVAFRSDPKGGKITGKDKIRTANLDFDDVYFVDELKFNLFSVSQMCDKKNSVLFTESECLILSPIFKFFNESQVVLRAPRKDDVYSLDLKNIIPSRGITCLYANATADESKLWHRRLGRVNFKNINKLVKGHLVRGLPSKVFVNDHTCVACKKGKQHKASYKAKLERIIRKPLELLHMDLFGPVSVESINKERCDNGTEFKNHAMNELCAKKGIKREFSMARTPQQNGVAERKNKTLIEAARTMLADSLLPIPFWAEAVNTTCYVLNRVLVTKPQNKTPYELLIGNSLSISFMRPFGCPLTILNTLDSLGKFDEKSDEGYLLRYSTTSKAFRVYNKRTKTVEENLHINFLEDQPNVTGTGPNWMFDLDFITNSMNYIHVSVENHVNVDVGTQDSYVAGSSGKDKGPTQEYILLPLQPHRTRIPVEDVAPAAHEKPSESSPKDNDVQDSEDVADKEGQHQMTEDEQVLHDELEKMIAQEVVAKALDDATRQAFEEEKRNIASQKRAAQTTSITKLSTGRSSVSTATTPYVSAASTSIGANAGESSFVYLGGKIPIDASTLPNADLPIDPNMPDLEDDSDAFSSDGIFNGAYDDENVGDPKSAVQTRGKIQKASSAQQALVEAMQEELQQFKLQKVWILVDLPSGKKAIGTKIEAIKLFLAFASYMGFTVYQMDVKSAFLYGTIEEEVYVHQPPGFVDLAHPNKVYKESQDKYVADILKKFDFWSIRTATTPIESNKPLVKDEEGEDVDVHVYRSMIGSLMYLTASRPPHHSSNNKKPEAFSDSNYGGASLDRKSTTGGCQFLGRRLISWQCKKQTIVANSTTKAEYVAKLLSVVASFIDTKSDGRLWFQFMNTKIHIDNESTISVIKNPFAHSRTKHIEIRFHFIRDCYEKRLIEVIKIHTNHNVADLLTKGFDVTRFNFLVVSIGLLNL